MLDNSADLDILELNFEDEAQIEKTGKICKQKDLAKEETHDHNQTNEKLILSEDKDIFRKESFNDADFDVQDSSREGVNLEKYGKNNEKKLSFIDG